MVGTVYTLRTADDPAEKMRLDELYMAFREYQNSQTSFAPEALYDPAPRRILDLGCGGGSWAFDIAFQFPNAELIAVDASPTLLETQLLENMRFQMADVTQPLPFQPASFDIVHARLLFMHVPNASDALQRAATLVKPGGWLFVEDFDFSSVVRTGGPVVSQVMGLWCDILAADGADASFGGKMQSVIERMGEFGDIQRQRVLIPTDDPNAPEDKIRLGVGAKNAVKGLIADWVDRFSEQGMTKELIERFAAEMDSGEYPDCELEYDFVWARRT
ncbi:S-adenosyl-L-methionine-dependent methyltransferase [Favolaschia claudopus]|uniref:S-adenosyl-L-methionine-dependent methyltransferase n=1 Tax=Favolaschia claudopus TaxID=2862362 RepID=A0AAW0CLR8_9AGAR